MKKVLFFGLALIMIMGICGLAVAAETCKMNLKVGDSVYACNCGPGCDCKTMSKKPGLCACGKEMVQAKVTKVEDGEATLEAQGWEKPQVFKTVGKYACGCGSACDCNTISQKPGKCPCGKEMVQ